MSTIREELATFSKYNPEEVISHLVIGEKPPFCDDTPVPGELTIYDFSQEITEELNNILDREFYEGYGSIECIPFYAYTKNYVLFMHAYDGSEMLSYVPRNPLDPKIYKPSHVWTIK